MFIVILDINPDDGDKAGLHNLVLKQAMTLVIIRENINVLVSRERFKSYIQTIL
jgi:hypothetical protein